MDGRHSSKQAVAIDSLLDELEALHPNGAGSSSFGFSSGLPKERLLKLWRFRCVRRSGISRMPAAGSTRNWRQPRAR